MDANRFIKLVLIITGILFITGFVRSYLTGWGVPAIIVGNFTIPVVEGFIIAVLFLFVFKRWVKVEAT